MNKLDENVKKLLNESKAWIMSTMDTTPNAVPILFKKMDNEDNLILFDVFMKKSIENIKKNSQIAITIYLAL
ncbi:pyridoxamine 5'-phosphate oxidase family protein [Clostridium autoethanogenum]|uniref:Pyridoxamine 5'-phosphate oxidase family protein n=1 Tax=Clostridium autoethanogenum TaxID=84023 RepID=A0A3M0S5F1_9CLOT|nr:pyridoxamine 5'-phosphate oxidase family protein [Clostridium autoethanogenum]RMC93131.1 pyridoxamine 5'-phosphate oxidase family protein [Clostridium autoethanogenum]